MSKEEIVESKNDDPAVTRILRLWGLGFVGVIALYLALGWFDDKTELSPSHDSVAQFSLIVPPALALTAAVIVFFKTRKARILLQIVWAICAAFFVLLLSFMLSYRITALVENGIDFPSTKTKTFDTLIPLSRAYQTHGKSQSWNVQTMPLCANLDITQSDYNFLLQHRRPGDQNRNQDEISSKGYFCVRVTLQQAGEAIRILHAGSRTLPKGTVVICPLADQ